MKNFFRLTLFVTLSFSLTASIHAQNEPEWTRDINALPDSANVFPVRTLNDGSNNVIVLSTYSKPNGVGGFIKKIYLYKYSETGVLLWSLVYDNNGTGQPNGVDLAVDENGNSYIAGAFMEPLTKPLLMKVSAAGNVLWVRDSTTSFWSSLCDQVFFQNDRIYLKAGEGIAVFDTDGIEIWSDGNMQTIRMAVDHAGQVVLSASRPGTTHNLFRYDATGAVNFSDSTLEAKRITTDFENNILLLCDLPQYELVKYDSAGTVSWSKNDFPLEPGFGDIGFEVLTGYDNTVFVTGIADTMFKFTPDGDQLWMQPMNGLDNYRIAAQMVFDNMLAIAGAVIGPNGYDMKVAIYNLYGQESWTGYYNSNDIQEFPVDMTIDNSGVYVIEDNISNTTLVKFTTPYGAEIDYSLICVDSVWYDGTDPNLINVRIFNGNVSHLNYPSVQIVSEDGDTISNVNNIVNFFAQGGNSYQVYTDTIIVTGITNFHGYTFIMNELFGQVSDVIDWCLALNVPEAIENNIFIYPNPVQDNLFIQHNGLFNDNSRVEIYDLFGRMILNEPLSGDSLMRIDVSDLASGMYLLRIGDGKMRWVGKVVKE